MSSYPKKIKIVEVGPRDGLQNERAQIPTEAKIKFVHGLAKAGLKNIEATSFVHPKAVPQLADAMEVLTALDDLPEDTDVSVLVPNMRGLDRAISAGSKHIAVFTACSESFNQKNIKCGIEESFERITPVIERAKAEGIKIRGYVSTVFGCPYEGDVDPKVALAVTQRLLDLGCYEVSLGDTIGVATPRSVQKAMSVILEGVGPEKLALHFHDTRGTALVNVFLGMQLGIRVFDASAGGLGGCPYAPGAAGNLSTEDLVYFLQGLGVETGVDLEALAEASLTLEQSLDHPLPGRTVATFRDKFCREKQSQA
ncbi:MAG: hydroxymethylglutaryl-CoA lyase [Planctomycetota bacterium]|nr:hydroxymethylglutaryl-CoA lyase [Planctomycetota bacterium]